MRVKPDHGEMSYRGSGRLVDKVALVTGADSGIGRAVALAYAREGADVAISYFNEHEDAKETQRLVTDAGRRALMLPGDLADPSVCEGIVSKTVEALGHLDILVNNAAYWTPLIAQSFEGEKLEKFGEQSPTKRPAQPAELAPAYVLLASADASCINGEVLGVTGGTPLA